MKHHDIEIGGFNDTYENLAQKTLFSYKIANEAKTGSMILFHDDDCIIDYAKLVKFVIFKHPKDIYCFHAYSGLHLC